MLSWLVRVVLAIAITSCGAWKPIGAGVSAAATTCDMGQTLWASDGAKWDRKLPNGSTLVEGNALIGPKPGVLPIIGMFALDFALIAAALFVPKLPDWTRASVWAADSDAEFRQVGANYQYDGVCGIH